jgi:hypothetical protein
MSMHILLLHRSLPLLVSIILPPFMAVLRFCAAARLPRSASHVVALHAVPDFLQDLFTIAIVESSDHYCHETPIESME